MAFWRAIAGTRPGAAAGLLSFFSTTAAAAAAAAAAALGPGTAAAETPPAGAPTASPTRAAPDAGPTAAPVASSPTEAPPAPVAPTEASPAPVAPVAPGTVPEPAGPTATALSTPLVPSAPAATPATAEPPASASSPGPAATAASGERPGEKDKDKGGAVALISVALDAGLEYDSNPNRALAGGSDDTPRGSPLFRALGRGQFAYKGAKQRLGLGFAAGGKAFFLPQAADQHVGVIQLNYEHGAQLRRLRILGILDYYDSFQAPGELLEARRDLRTLSAGGRLVGSRSIRELHSIEGGLDLTGQYFEYKPDRELSFLSPSLLSRLGAHIHAGDPDLGHDFDLAVHARFDYRKYIGERQDLFVQLGTSLTWQGPLLVQLSYTGQLNISSLGSETYQRHLILAKLAFRLPGDIYITAKSQLNLLQGAPGLFVPVGNIDDDNRSLAIFDLERPLRRGVALSARYTGYFSLPNESGSPYQRHTGYLGFTYNFRTVRRR